MTNIREMTTNLREIEATIDAIKIVQHSIGKHLFDIDFNMDEIASLEANGSLTKLYSIICLISDKASNVLNNMHVLCDLLDAPNPMVETAASGTDIAHERADQFVKQEEKMNVRVREDRALEKKARHASRLANFPSPFGVYTPESFEEHLKQKYEKAYKEAVAQMRVEQEQKGNSSR